MRDPSYPLAVGALVSAVLGERIPGVLQLDLQERRDLAPTLGRRSERTVEETLSNEKQRGGYFSSCTVGTPPQEVVLLLDTGSSDTWIPATDAPACSERFSVDPCPLGSCESMFLRLRFRRLGKRAWKARNGRALWLTMRRALCLCSRPWKVQDL